MAERNILLWNFSLQKILQFKIDSNTKPNFKP